ncbi:MAG: ABC transporter substrate-binding protein, partial [Rhodocyclaceae bacterium]
MSLQNYCFVVLLFCCWSTAGTASAADKVRLQLKWQHQFQFAGYYAALEKGYYRAAGLDVEIVPGGPTVDAARNVLDGKAEFGVGTTDLLLLREKGEPVVVLATIFQHSSLALMTLKTPHPQDLHDLAGKRLMIEPGSAELLAYLRREGITPERYSLLPHGSTVADLIEGKTDAMSVYATDEPFELLEAKRRFVLYSPRAGGIDFYGDNLFTTESQLGQFPERAKAFRAASLKGWKYAMEHPDEMATLIHSRYSDRHSLAHLRYEVAQMADLLRTDIVEPGHMYVGRWQHIVRVYAELGMLKPNFELGGFLYDATPRPPDPTRFFAGMAGLTLLLLVVGSVALYIARINRHLTSGEKRWRQLFDTLPLALIVSDRDEKIVAWNAAATRIFGWSADEASGRDVYELLVPDDQQAHVHRVLGQTLDEQTTTQSLNRNRTKAGA